MNGITACVMTKNSERTIARCLEKLASFDEILVLDTGSEDGTLAILDSFPGVKILKQDGIDNFGRTRNRLASQASNDWILMVDSDEILTDPMIADIHVLPNDPKKVYCFLRINHYRGRPIRACGWHPDYCYRLYHRTATSWKERIVHEVLLLPDSVVPVKCRTEMHHFSCDGAEQLARKGIWYAELFAADFAGKRRTSFFGAAFHGAWMFIRSYFFRGGIWYGRDGFIIAYFAAFGSWMKYLLLLERTEESARRSSSKAELEERTRSTPD